MTHAGKLAESLLCDAKIQFVGNAMRSVLFRIRVIRYDRAHLVRPHTQVKNI
jgi:hypothetical protein